MLTVVLLCRMLFESLIVPHGVHWLSWLPSQSHLSNNTMSSTTTDRSSIWGGDGTMTEHSLWTYTDLEYWYKSKWSLCINHFEWQKLLRKKACKLPRYYSFSQQQFMMILKALWVNISRNNINATIWKCCMNLSTVIQPKHPGVTKASWLGIWI